MYAVSEDEIENRRKSFDEVSANTTSTPRKRRRISSNEISETALDGLITEVSEMKGQLEAFKKLSFKHKFSLSFLQSLEDTFSCCICRRHPPKSPIVACYECASIIGCQKCLDRWYSGGLNKPCPKCRTPRGLAKSFHFKGFDDLISQIKVMENLSSSSESESDDDGGAYDDTLPIVIPNDD